MPVANTEWPTFESGIQQVHQEIAALDDLRDLPRLSQSLRTQSMAMASAGMRGDRLSTVIASWNDALVRVVLRQHGGAFEGLRWCWLALGSQGRMDQTIGTDQDNALIFVHSRPEHVRERLLPALREINQCLDRAGYALCPGEVMASNPRWCLSLDEWKSVCSHWIDLRDPESLLHAAIFFDFRGIAGDPDLAIELRRWLNRYLSPRPVFLEMLAQRCLDNHPPLTPWHSLRGRRYEGEKVIDIKLNGVSLLVDAARIFALAAGLDQTCTVERLRRSASTSEQRLNAQAWVGAYHWLQDLRMRHQLSQLARGEEADNRILLTSMSRFERRVLVAALLEAGRAQRSLRIRYAL